MTSWAPALAPIALDVDVERAADRAGDAARQDDQGALAVADRDGDEAAAARATRRATAARERVTEGRVDVRSGDPDLLDAGDRDLFELEGAGEQVGGAPDVDREAAGRGQREGRAEIDARVERELVVAAACEREGLVDGLTGRVELDHEVGGDVEAVCRCTDREVDPRQCHAPGDPGTRDVEEPARRGRGRERERPESEPEVRDRELDRRGVVALGRLLEGDAGRDADLVDPEGDDTRSPRRSGVAVGDVERPGARVDSRGRPVRGIGGVREGRCEVDHRENSGRRGRAVARAVDVDLDMVVACSVRPGTPTSAIESADAESA